MIIFFNPDDSSIARFLDECGLDAKALRPEGKQLGYVSDQNLEPALFEYLQFCASLEPHSVDSPRFMLSKREADFGLMWLNRISQRKRHALFETGIGPDGYTASVILRDLLLNKPYYGYFEDMAVENNVSMADLKSEDFTPEDFSRVFFTENMVPENWQMSGQSVVRIDTAFGNGSGIVISERGEILTARHVLYDGENLAAGITIEIGGKKYPITAEDIVVTDAGQDLAVVRLPERAVHADLQVAKLTRREAKKGDLSFAVGYPGVGNEKDRHYTAGRFLGEPEPFRFPVSPAIEASALGLGDLISQHHFTDHDALMESSVEYVAANGTFMRNRTGKMNGLMLAGLQTYPGNSGGALFNEQGEVVGLVVAREELVHKKSGERFYAARSYVVSLDPDQIDHPRIKKILERWARKS